MSEQNRVNMAWLLQANDEKMRLEEKQRQERNAAEAAGKSFGDPIWFYKVPLTPC